jgi:signal transduction histidine kinase
MIAIILPGLSIGAMLLVWAILTLSDAPWGEWGRAKAYRLADEAASKREAERVAAFREQYAREIAEWEERQRLASSLACNCPNKPTSGA